MACVNDFASITFARLGRGFLCAGALLLALTPAQAADVKVVADTLTLHADRTPLRDILQEIHNAGIVVRIDDRINPPITVTFDKRNLRDALDRLLEDYDYALVSTVIDGPAGRTKRVSEINVYVPGDRRALKPLADPGTALSRAQVPFNKKSILCLKDEVLIRLKKGTSLDAFRALLSGIGGTVVDALRATGVYRVHLAPGSDLADVLKALAENPLVDRAEPNLVYRPVDNVRSDSAGAADGGSTPQVRRNKDGEAAPVAVLDTGLLASAGLKDCVVASLDAVVPDRPLSDSAGHGTQMALLASGAAVPMGANAGVSPDGVPIIPIRAFDDNGYASGFALMNSLTFALDNGARVISMSWGSPVDSAFFDDAVAYAAQRGAVLVAAAGNEPTGQPIYPAGCSNVIAVSALASDGTFWPQSNYGGFVSLAAPGFASFPVGYKGPAGTYAGTSVSTAYAANILAQYFAKHPDATPAQASAALTQALTHADPSAAHSDIGRLDSQAVTTFLK